MKVNSKISLTWGVAAVFACAILYLLYMQSATVPRMTMMQHLFQTQEKRSFDYDVWPPFQAPANEQHEQEWFQHYCLPSKVKLSIANLGTVLSQWAKTSNSQCRKLLVTFQTIYSVSTRNASVSLPEPFQQKVRGWLGYDEKLFKEMFSQEVIHVVNRFTREHTIFNPLRDKRPVLPPDEPEEEYFNSLLKETSKKCDFCHFKSYTAEHLFHRIENEYAFSASNAFKVDTLHALIGLKQHDPLRWSPQSFMGLMNLSVAWFNKAHQAFPSARFPSVIWDVLPKCGASQVHPHLQGFLDPERYHGTVESWRLGAQDYFSITSANFYADMAKVSASLGLAVTHKSAIAFASLVPRKDHEVVVMAPAAGKDFFEMVYFVLRAFVDDLDKYCFSMGLAYPELDGLEAVIPAYARIITRGVVTDLRTDISSLELFAATNVNIDPFTVTEVVRDSVQKRHSSFEATPVNDVHV